MPDENLDFSNFENSSPNPNLTEVKITSKAVFSEDRDEDLASQRTRLNQAYQLERPFRSEQS